MLTHPDRIAKGLRDYIAWEMCTKAEVEIAPGPGYFLVRVMMDPEKAKPDPETMARDLGDMLPPDYRLDLTWTTDS